LAEAEGMARRRCLLSVAAASAVIAPAAVPVAASVTQTEPGPALVVTPDDNLVDGQTILVEGAGFTAGESVWLLQCRAGISSASDLLTLCEPKGLPTVDASGSFSAFPTVDAVLEPDNGSSGLVDCQAAVEACSIVVAYDWPSSWVQAPITFIPGQIPVPKISVRPAALMEDGDVVTVSGTGFAAASSITIMQCLHNHRSHRACLPRCLSLR
jgi:Neocarzinostatin family